MIIAAHDLSGVGRCSLTTALAVLPALGHSCYPLPTAILSQQTDLRGYSFLDSTPYLPEYLRGWQELDLSPDLIYTGFLGNGRQTELLSDFISKHPDALVVVDPVMGDNAEIYSCYDEAFTRDMRGLVKSAHILLPNTTEFNLLAGRSEKQPFPGSMEEVLSLSLGIDAPRLRYIVITSAVSRLDSRCVMCNLIVDIAQKTAIELPCRNSGVSYNGAGDLFASVICGLLMNGLDLTEAVRCAAGFVADAIDFTPEQDDPRFGIRYEPLLSDFATSHIFKGDTVYEK